jgi:hypothetical protein
MIVFRNKKTNKLYTVGYVQGEIDKTIVEYSGDRSLFREYLDEKFTTIDLFENPLTEEQQEEIKEDFEQSCRHWAEQNILSKYEVNELITEE